MLFNSLAYGVFLTIVFALYWALPHRFRWVMLLVASYYFYMNWNVKYVVLILFTTFVSYGCARLVEGQAPSFKKRVLLFGTAAASLGVLFFFKYFNFASNTLSRIFGALSIPLHPATLSFLLPVGISFYTFQTLSYVADVYRGDIPAEKNFFKYALFISFFPQLVAGPIERADHLLPQLFKEHTFEYRKACDGLKRMAWGFFKKMVVADNLAKYADTVFNDPQGHRGFAVILAMCFFSIQIYCDFSGYSDIAVGTAKLLGIDLMDNFRCPYFSASIHEFWSRWHISLSTWFRDYVYIPLGGNRVSKPRHYANLMITFLTSGLWHGANWTFVIWGGLHGAIQIAENAIFGRKLDGGSTPARVFRIILVFIFCTIAWVFFRANSLSDIPVLFKNACIGWEHPRDCISDGLIVLSLDAVHGLILAMSLLLLFVYDFISLKMDPWILVGRLEMPARYACYAMLLVIILLFQAPGENAFVYFQF